MQTFVANEFISLKLEKGKTQIYINDKLFNQCKFLLITLPVDEFDDFEGYDSMDEVIEAVNSNSIDKILKETSKRDGRTEPRADELSNEEEFIGHCSNIQAWVENDYNYRILESKLSIPIIMEILKGLTKPEDRERFKTFFTEVVESLDDYIINSLNNEATYDRFEDLEEMVCRTKNRYFSDEEIGGSILLSSIYDRHIKQYLAKKLAAREHYQKVGRFNRWEAKLWGTGTVNLTHRRFLRAIRSDDEWVRNRMIVSDGIGYLPYLYSTGKFQQVGNISLYNLEEGVLIIRDENGHYWINQEYHDREKDYGGGRW